MDQSRENLKSANPLIGLPGAVFEKAWELRWGLKLAYVCLFLDSSLAYAMHQNLLNFSGNMAMVWEHLGAIFVAITMFCLVVSILIPVLARFTVLVGGLLPWQWFERHQRYDIHHGYVTFSSLREHSLRNGDEFVWKLWDAEETARSEERVQRYQAGELVFGLLVMAVANVAVGVKVHVNTIVLSLTSSIGVSGCAVLGLILIRILYWAWWATEGISQIYYPPLYDALRADKHPLARPQRTRLSDPNAD